MHLITQPVHMSPCSNLAMKGNIGTNRIPRYFCPNHHRTSPMLHCWNQASCFVGFLGVLQMYAVLNLGKIMKDNLSDHIMHVFSVVWWLLHHHLCIWALLSVIRGLAIVALLWMLDIWSSYWTFFCRNSIFRMNIQFCCSSWFFKTILGVQWTLSVSVDFLPLFLFTDVLPWIVCAGITLETVALDTPNNVAVFLSQMVQLSTHQWSVIFQRQISLPFSDAFTHTLTQHNY
jgi:hypothetical protein